MDSQWHFDPFFQDCVCWYVTRRQDSLPQIRPDRHADDKRADATGVLHDMITRGLSCLRFRKRSISGAKHAGVMSRMQAATSE